MRLVLPALALWAGAVLAAGPVEGDAFSLPEIPVERYTLGNGLTVLLSRDTSIPVVAVDVWYHVGSRNERPGRTGFAHLCEHLAFQGTQHATARETDRIVEEAGGRDANGSTSNDRTNFHVTLPSGELETALWAESERMGFLRPVLSQEKLDVQRGVVLNERRQRIDNRAYGASAEFLSAALFPASHPYAWPILGSMQDLHAARLTDVIEFFDRYYVPNNATLAVVGDFDVPAAKALIEKYFGPIPAGAKVDRPQLAPVALAAEKRLVLEDPQGTVPELHVAWPTAGRRDPSAVALSALADVLAHDRTSRLTRLLIDERELATAVTVSHEVYEAAGQFLIRVQPRPGVSLSTIEHLIDSTLDALAKNGPTAVEMAHFRSAVRVSAVLQLDGAHPKAEILLGGQVFHGDPLHYLKHAQAQLRLTATEISHAQRTHLTRARVVLSLVPQGQAAAAANPVPGQTVLAPPSAADIVASSRADPPVPVPSTRATPETFDRSRPGRGTPRSLALPVPQRLALRNGIPVFVLEDSRIPAVSVSVVFDVPAAQLDPPGKTGLGEIVQSMLGEGTLFRTAEQMAGAGAALGTQVTAQGFYTISAHVKEALALMAEQLRSSAFPESALRRTTANFASRLARQRADPDHLAARVFRTVVHGAGHPHARAPTEAEVTSISRDDVQAYHAAYYRPPNIRFVIVGNITAESAVAALETHFGDWKSGEMAWQAPPPPKSPPEHAIYLYDRPGSAQSVIVVGRSGPRRDSADRYAIDLVNTAFGGTFSSRWNLNLRELRHYTYSAFSSFEFRRPPQVSTFTATTAVETADTAEALAETLRELDALHGSRPLSGAEVDFARAAVVNAIPLRLQTLPQRAEAIARIVAEDLPLDEDSRLISGYEAVTAAQAAHAARQYFSPVSQAIVIVGDLKVIEPALRALSIAPIVVVPPLRD